MKEQHKQNTTVTHDKQTTSDSLSSKAKKEETETSKEHKSTIVKRGI